MAINLLPEPVEKPTIDITEHPPITSEVSTAARVERYDYAMQDMLPPQQVQDSVMLGFEDSLREQAYFNEVMKDRERKHQIIQDLANQSAAEGRSISQQEHEYIMDLTGTEIRQNPNTILETLYARRFIQDMASEPNSEVRAVAEAAPEAADMIVNAVEDNMTKQGIAQRILEEQRDRQNNAGWFTNTVDFGEQLIPGLSWLRTQDRIEGTNNEGQFFAGSNIESQIQSLYFMSPEAFETNLRAAVEELSGENTFDAMLLAQAAVEYSSENAGWDNLFGALDAVDIATLGAGAAMTVARKSQSAVRAAKAGGSIARQVAQGNIAGASQTAVNTRLAQGVLQPLQPTSPAAAVGSTRPQRMVDELSQAVPGMLDSQSFFRNAGSLTAERQQRLMTEVSRSEALVVSTMTDVTHGERISDAARALAFQEAEKRFRVTNHRLDQSIVDIVPHAESKDVFSGTDFIKIRLGTKEATGFTTETQAGNFAKNVYRLPDGGYEVEAFQGNYFITLTQNIDETSLGVSLARIQTENAAPQSFINSWIWGLRSPDDVLSKEHTAARKLATYGGNAVMERLQAAAQNLGSLGKNESARLRDIMEEAQFKTRKVVQPDGSVKDVAGVFYEDVGAFESAYRSRHNSMPSDKEIAAYFEFRNIMNWDFVQKNLSVYRDKARLGIEQYSTNVSVAVPNTKLFTQKSTPFFEGRVVEELPSSATGSYTIGWVDPKSGKPKFNISDRLYRSESDSIKEALESGKYKIIQVADPKNKEIREVFDAKGEPLQFVLVRDVKQKPLSTVQVPHNEGGHWMYPQSGYYIKQAQVHQGRGRKIYDGDTTAFYSQSGDVGRKFAEAHEVARKMLVDNDPRLDAYVTANLPYRNATDFTNRFRSDTNPEGVFSRDTPFVLTQSGQSARDVVKLEDLFSESIFDAGGDANSLSSRIVSSYTQERSERLLSVDTVGTQTNPAYKLSPAQTLDPMQALAVSASGMARGRFYDDYKHRAIEDWISQFSDTIDAPLAEVRADPMRFLKEPVYRKDFQDNVKLAAAKANRRAILSILGQDTDFHKAWKWTRQKLVDETYKRAGKKAANIVDPIFWDNKTDPSTIMRSSVFHPKLGLFNPAQFLLQSSAATMALAIDGNPLRAARAPLAYWAMRARGLSSINPKGQGAIAKAAGKALGLDPQYLDEMHDAWKRSGMHIVEGEYGGLDDYLNPNEFVSSNSGKRALDAGLFFFKEGNNVHRGTSFSLAYMKWRDENPGRKMTNRDLQGITARADILYVNMSRASNAPWQNGKQWWQQATGIAGQFFGFQARLTELMLGNRLTAGEKLRLFGVNAAMWGIPVGGLGTVAGAFWPFGESVSEYMIANNIDTDANLVTKFMADGMVDVIGEYVVGEDMNLAERFGPGGLSFAKDFVSGDFGELLGASPNFISQTMALSEPFMMASAGVFFGGPQYDLGVEDFVDVLKEVSSVNQGLRAYMALNSGEWVNKKDDSISDVSQDPKVAIAIALGLTPQDIGDMYLRMQDNKSVMEMKRQVSDLALREFQRGLKAAREGDSEQTLHFYRRAHAYMESGDFSPLEKSQLWRRAMTDNQTTMERVDREFLMNDPTERSDWYQNQWEERLGKGY